MAIVHMKKLRLMVVRGQKDALLRDLMLLGCVQVSEPDALLADAEAAAVLRQESGNVTETRSELTRLNAALKLLDKYAPVKSKLLSSRPEVTEREFLDVGAYRKELDAVAQLEELEADVRRYNGEEAKLRSSVEALRPWETLDLPLSLGSTATTRITLGMLPAAADFAEAQETLEEAAPESQMYEISADREQHYVLLICMKDELTEARKAANGDVDGLRRRLDEVQDRMDAASLNSEEWNVLYRMRLQVEQAAARRRDDPDHH